MGVSLITGGRGFVGGWLAKALVERGERVVSFDRKRTTEKPATIGMLGVEGEVEQVQADLCDAGEVRRTLEGCGAETVYHLAAETIVATVQSSPVQGFESNVRGTWTLLQACRELGIERVVVASSDKAYGPHDELPYREDYALRPVAPYEASKAAADLIARSFWSSYGLPVAVTRFANVYGGGDLNFSRLVPETVSAALQGRRAVLRSDGTPSRDFLYVEDAADAYVAIAQGLDRDEVRGEAFNAGGGEPVSVLDVARLIGELAGADVGPDLRGSGNPAGEIDRQWVDPEKIRTALGWEPAVGLREGLERTIEWYRAHPEAWAPPPE